MSSLNLKNIYKIYPNGVKAVSNFNLEIEDKEFIVFVGPSGCGKSTTLRMIAGLEEITSGELYIDGKLVNDVAPKDRDIAMVFQSYALYPHMTVYDNMAFALKLRKMPKAEIDARVREAARILDIEMYLARKPKALSGGQRQRVALGRAIVREPKVFLLDEPLSNLDAKLRTQMRTEITKLHDRLATTFIYVTHDQVEAMTMGSKIVVMKDGKMLQVDTPQDLFDYPVNQFVAGFIGTPQMNFFKATLSSNNGKVLVNFFFDEVNEKGEAVEIKGQSIELPESKVLKLNPWYLDGKTKVLVGIRPEDIHDEEVFISNSSKTIIECKVDVVEKLGPETLIYCDMDTSKDMDEIVAKSSSSLIAKVDPRTRVLKGEIVKFAVDANHIHIFDIDTEQTLLPRIPEYNIVDAKLSGKLSDLKVEILDEVKIDIPQVIANNLENSSNYIGKNGKVSLGISPAFVKIVSSNDQNADTCSAKVISIEKVGNKQIIYAEIKLTKGSKVVFVETDEKVKVGDSIRVCFDVKGVTLFDAETKAIILDKMPAENKIPFKCNKATIVNDKINVKVIKAVANINGQEIVIPDRTAYKISSSLKRGMFKHELEFLLKPSVLRLLNPETDDMNVNKPLYGANGEVIGETEVGKINCVIEDIHTLNREKVVSVVIPAVTQQAKDPNDAPVVVSPEIKLFVYVALDSKLKKGDKVTLVLDIDDASIVDKKLDIIVV